MIKRYSAFSGKPQRWGFFLPLLKSLAKLKTLPLGLILNMLLFPKFKGFFQKLFNIRGSSGSKLDLSDLGLAENKSKNHPRGLIREPCVCSFRRVIAKISYHLHDG